MNTNILEELGLTKNESEIYLTLLDLGQTNINGISEQLGLHRRTIYDCLIRLEQKGLTSHVIENQTKIFYAHDPKKLALFLDEKEEELKQKRKEINAILPQLLAVFNQTKHDNNLYVYKGIKGLQKVFKEILKEKPKEYLAFGSTGTVREIMPEFLIRTYQRYQTLGIKIKAIVINTPERIKRAKELNRQGHEIRVMDSSKDSPLTTYIINKRTVFMVWSQPNPYAIIIDDPLLTQGFKNYFLSLWKTSKKP